MEQCVSVTEVRVLGDYRLELGFSDGRRGTVDLRERIVGRGGLYEVLENVEYFRQVRVESEYGTVVWPNGVDICPDLLHSLALGDSEAQAKPSAS